MRSTQSSVKAPREYIDPQWRIGIVYSAFYEEEIAALVENAKQSLVEAGIGEENITLHEAAGSFEVPLIGAALADAKNVDALIGFGIIVEGDTHHAEVLANASARGMMDVQVQYRIPFAFEILYVHSIDQARERLDKGAEAANAALHSLAVKSTIQS